MDEVVTSGVRRFLTPFNFKLCILLMLLALIAQPFGMSGIASMPSQILFWAIVIPVSSLMGHLANSLGESFWGEDRPLLCDMTMLVVMVAAFTPVLILLINRLLTTNSDPVRVQVAAGYVALITTVIAVFRRIVPGLTRYSYLRKATPREDPRLYRRLPDRFRGPVLRLAVRDHFVDVVTAEETHTIRMRFADAVDEMETEPGYCTHRSHWVSRDAVVRVERADGRWQVRLINGDVVPVSRTYRPELARAGLIDAQEAAA